MREPMPKSSDPCPSWLDLPKETPEEHVEQEHYWACFVHRETPAHRWFWQKKPPKPKIKERVIYPSAEEAEAYTVRNPAWDGEPARTISLKEALHNARVHKADALVCIGWKGGKWVILKRGPTNEPAEGVGQ